MAVENGVWTMYGMDWDDPYRIRSYRELINWINEIGFLPFYVFTDMCRNTIRTRQKNRSGL